MRRKLANKTTQLVFWNWTHKTLANFLTKLLGIRAAKTIEDVLNRIIFCHYVIVAQKKEEITEFVIEEL